LATYFGNQTESNTTAIGAVVMIWMPYTGSFTCPGSGNQVVKELSSKVGTTGNIRLCIYNAGSPFAKKVEGTGEVAVSGGTTTWQGHMTQASMTPNPATLTGGANYILAMASDNSSTVISYNASPTYDTDLNFADYTGGLPSAPPSSDGQSGSDFLIRCGVDQEVAGGPIAPFTINFSFR
jgi:hypothetical protein